MTAVLPEAIAEEIRELVRDGRRKAPRGSSTTPQQFSAHKRFVSTVLEDSGDIEVTQEFVRRAMLLLFELRYQGIDPGNSRTYSNKRHEVLAYLGRISA